MTKNSQNKFQRQVLWLLPILATALLLIEGWLMPAPTIAITMGDEAGLNEYGQGKHLYNFFGWGHLGTEKGKLARRIHPDPIASFMIPFAQRLGTPLSLEMTMCGCGSTLPVTFTINTTTYTIPLQQEWQRYQFDIDQTPTMYEDALYMQWQSNANPRPLLHSVVVQAERPDGWLIGSLLVGVVVAALMLLNKQQPLQHRLMCSGIFVVSAAISRWFYQPQLLPWVALIGLGSLVAILLTLMCPSLPQKLFLWLLTLWVLATPQILGTWILDDAFISFRYAKNFINGYGITFNPGGEMVEGYTNFLWTMLMAGFMALHFEPVVTAQILCTLLSLLTILLTYRIAESWWSGQFWTLLPPLLLASNPSFLLYTARGSGMETALVAFLSTATLYAFWHTLHTTRLTSGLIAGLLAALVVMTRPDAALVPIGAAIIFIGYSIMLLLQQQRQKTISVVKALAGVVLGGLLVYGPYFLWRYSYYGYLLPNTFYAKTGATYAQVERGFAYTRDFFMGIGLRGLLILFGLSIVGMSWAKLREKVSHGAIPCIWIILILTSLYVTAVGGDHFPLGRFFVPIIPLLTLLMTHGVASGWEMMHTISSKSILRWVGWVPAMLAMLALLLSVTLMTMQLPSLDSRNIEGRIWGENYVALKNREMGLWFRETTPYETVIATGIAGALPYYADRYVIDALGLNDVYIAHLSVEDMGQGIAGAEKTDPVYILNQEPDYIPHSSSGEFVELERFQQQYERIIVRGPEGGEMWLYKRRSP